jgi:RecA-family ATPase
VADGNGKQPYRGQSAAFEAQFTAASDAYRANGFVHNDGRDLAPKNMAETLGKPPPDLKWLVPDYIPMRTVTLLTGDGGVGKSLLAMQLMTCVSAGRPFLGMECTQGRAFGLFCEDEDQILHHRQLRMSEALHVADKDLAHFYYLDRAGEDSVMYGPMLEDSRSMDFTDFYFRIHKIIRAIKPILIVFDTAADIFGASENNRPDVRAFIRTLRKLSYDFNAAVVLCAHPSQSGIQSGRGYSGSTAWHNSVRSRIYLTKPDDGSNDDDRLISGKKNNYGPAQGDLRIRYTAGAFLRIEGDTGTVARIERSARERAIIDLVRGEAVKRQWLSSNVQAMGRYLPKVAAKAIPGMSFGLAKRILEDLMIDGAILSEMVDSDTKKRGLIVPEVPGAA